MPRSAVSLVLAILLSVSAASARPQAPPAAPTTSPLREIRSDGLKSLTDTQIAAISGLQTGSQVGRDDLQSAADKLVQSGLFAHVKYNFQTRADGLIVIFHLEEAPR